MGDGSLNPSIISGMLPALSDDNPYTIRACYTGLKAGSGAVWKAFDQDLLYGERWCAANCTYGSHPEYIPEEFMPDEWSQADHNVLIDLGESNSKCFDKFSYSQSEYDCEYYTINAFIIQGSNNPSVAVADVITSPNWVSIYMFNESTWVSVPPLYEPDPHSYAWYNVNNWVPFHTFVNTEAYRFYRICVRNPYNFLGEGSSFSVNRFIFVEEVQPEPKLTKLILHMDGVDESQVFVDSSAAPHTVISNGEVKQDTGWYQLGTASAQFESSADYLSITDDLNWEIFNKPFTIHFWFKPVSVTGEQTIFKQLSHTSTYMICSYNHDTGIINFEVKIWGKQRIYIKAAANLVLGAFTHIAIVGR